MNWRAIRRRTAAQGGAQTQTAEAHRQGPAEDAPKSSTEKIDAADIGLGLLGLASGAMDALAFLDLGEVFTSAMTGNTALLGLTLGRGDLMAASRPAMAFVGFLVGAAAATAAVDLRLAKLAEPRAVFWLLASEACLLAAFASGRALVEQPIAGAAVYSLILIASLGMGIQNVAARIVGRSGVTTVVFTSTLTAIVTSATKAIHQAPHRLPFATQRQIGMFLMYAVGAAACGLLAPHGAAIALIPFAAVAAAAALHRSVEQY